MTEYDRELQQEKELEYIKTQPFFTRLRWFIRQAKKDRDGSFKFNFRVFLFIAGILILIYLFEEVIF